MQDVEFVDFTADRLEDAARVYADCFNRPPWNDGWTQETAEARLKVLINRETAISRIAVLGGSVIALAVGHVDPWLSGSHFYLSEFCAAPHVQRTGVGKKLLSDLMRVLADSNVQSVFLLTDLGAPGEGFFSDSGFKRDPTAIKMTRRAPDAA